jgi:phosphatidate cytidylyltransferase
MMAEAARKSDLAIRTVSAVVMLAIAGTALYMGGTVFTFFVALVAFTVVLEWRNIVVKFPESEFAKGVWMACGGLYAAFACAAVLMLYPSGIFILVLAGVIGTDIGAYFAGRAIGGPKIAPKISPSKTWAGLIGGMVGATVVFWLMEMLLRRAGASFYISSKGSVVFGICTAIIAQTGDFFESWMKRRAGVKDSGNLLPGHGGMFDRVDGLLPVCIAAFLFAHFRGLGLVP